MDAALLASARQIMVDRQVRPSDVTRPELVDAMLAVPREAFLPRAKRAVAYAGEHVELAPGRVELDPRVFAKMVDAAEPSPSDLTLVVGLGHGYAAAIFSRLGGAVVGLECAPDLAAAAKNALAEGGFDNVVVAEGPLEAGSAEYAPYNVIFVNGAVSGGAADALEAQLAENGRLVCIRMSGVAGVCEVAVQSGGAIGRRAAFDAAAPVLPGLVENAGFVF